MNRTDLFTVENNASATPYRARYTATFDGPQEALVEAIQHLLADLDATYVDPDEEIRLNPVTNQYEVQTVINQEFEFDLTIYWSVTITHPISVIFDITTPIPIEFSSFNTALEDAIAEYFRNLQLTYNFLTRSKVTSQKLPLNSDVVLNQDWIQQNRADYIGRWVALRQGELLADASSVDELVKQLETIKGVLLTVVY